MTVIIKMKYFLIGAIGIFISSTGMANEHKAYIQFNAGVSFAPSFSQSHTISPCFAFPSGFDCSPINQKAKETYDTGFTGGIALGYRLAEQFRLEGEVLYESNDRDKYHFNATSNNPVYNHSFTNNLVGERERFAFLLNAYYDFKNSTAFTPYLTAGLGGYHLRLKLERDSIENELDFAWQAGAGINYRLNENISFDIKYRYLGGADAELKLPTFTNLPINRPASMLYNVGDHQLVAGIRVGF